MWQEGDICNQKYWKLGLLCLTLITVIIVVSVSVR